MLLNLRACTDTLIFVLSVGGISSSKSRSRGEANCVGDYDGGTWSFGDTKGDGSPFKLPAGEITLCLLLFRSPIKV